MLTYQSTNPLARANPLRSLPLYLDPSRIVPRSEHSKAEWALNIARGNLPIAEQRFAAYCAALGNANKMRGPMRRHWQAQAFRQINVARSQLRAARKALASAEMAMLPFALAA